MSWEPFRVRDAKAAAQTWVDDVAWRLPGFRGAFLHGSLNWLADDIPLPPNSDTDVIVVLDGSETSRGPGKFPVDGVLLDVSVLAAAELESSETVLGNSHLAGSFRGANVLADTSGDLTRLQERVTRDFAQRYWVLRRCEHARDKVLRFLYGIEPSALFHDQVIAWLFGTSVTTHILLSAGLKNPTVRKRYLATRELLVEYGRLDVYEDLLSLLGCAEWTRSQTEHYLEAMTKAFDAAREIIQSPFPFAADISDAGRPIAVDGSLELIETGYHREAAFWIAVTYSRCQAIVHHDHAPGFRNQFTPGFLDLLSDLGIVSPADLLTRAELVRAYLPRLRGIAEEVIAANPDIIA